MDFNALRIQPANIQLCLLISFLRMSWEGLGTAEPTFESQGLDKTQWMRILIWTSLFLYALKAISVVAAEYSDFRGIRKAAAVNYDKQWEHFGNRTVRKDKPFLTKIFTFFVIFPQKHILWVLIGSSSRRQKTHVFNPSCACHYENTPIQIYGKMYLQKLKIFR